MRRDFLYTGILFMFVAFSIGFGQTVEQKDADHYKKPKHTAIAMSLGVVNWIVPCVLSYKLEDQEKYKLADWVLSYGVIAGPSMGNYYAGDKKRFYIGTGIRAAVYLGYLTYYKDKPFEEDAAWAIWGVLTGSSLWSIWSSRSSVREYNARINRVSLLPIVNPENNSIGFSAAVSF